MTWFEGFQPNTSRAFISYLESLVDEYQKRKKKILLTGDHTLEVCG